MFKISNNTRSNSDSSSQSESRSFNNFDGWGEETEFDNSVRLIKAANRKVKLIDILNFYNVKIVKAYDSQVWSNLTTCPFESHKGARERTPSFGYNFIEKFFHCFGCGASGKTVEFLALKEKRSKLSIAEKIIADYGDIEIVNDIDEEEPNLDPLFFSLATLFREKIKTCKNDKNRLEQVNKIMWWADSFISERVPENNISVDELEYRIQRIRELLDEV